MKALDTAPRWFLLIVCGVAIMLCIVFFNFIIKSAFADMEKVRGIAWQAKNLSDANQSDIVDLKLSISSLKVSQEIFRKEYREDQKDLDRKLSELLNAVNK